MLSQAGTVFIINRLRGYLDHRLSRKFAAIVLYLKRSLPTSATGRCILSSQELYTEVGYHQWIIKDSANKKKGDEIKSFRCDEKPDYKIYSHALRSMFSPRLLARSLQSRVPTLCLVHRCSLRSGMLVMMARNYLASSSPRLVCWQ